MSASLAAERWLLEYAQRRRHCVSHRWSGAGEARPVRSFACAVFAMFVLLLPIFCVESDLGMLSNDVAKPYAYFSCATDAPDGERCATTLMRLVFSDRAQVRGERLRCLRHP